MSESNLDEEAGGIDPGDLGDLGELGGEEEGGDISLDDDLASALDEGGGEGDEGGDAEGDEGGGEVSLGLSRWSTHTFSAYVTDGSCFPLL